MKLTVWIVWKSIKHFLTLRGISRRINNWFSLPETGPEFSSLVSASVSRLTILREIPCNHHSCKNHQLVSSLHWQVSNLSQSNVIVCAPAGLAGLHQLQRASQGIGGVEEFFFVCTWKCLSSLTFFSLLSHHFRSVLCPLFTTWLSPRCSLKYCTVTKHYSSSILTYSSSEKSFSWEQSLQNCKWMEKTLSANTFLVCVVHCLHFWKSNKLEGCFD